MSTKNKKYLLGVLAILFPLLMVGQKVSVTLLTLDSISNEPLPFTSVILSLSDSTQSTEFGQGNEDGKFSVQVNRDVDVTIEAFFIGYNDYSKRYSIGRADTTIRIFLSQSTISFKEIVVRDTLPPIIFKDDTITYNANHFTTGNERKLRDLVERLPGLEIDDGNNITFKGSPIDKVLVEKKLFFGGSSELALNGIPADAVKNVQVIKDYNKYGFQLGSDIENELALNIEIKEEKKNIYFGDALLGGGIPNSYKVSANLFNYKKNRNLYGVIGSNNINEEVISLEQSIRLLNSSSDIPDAASYNSINELLVNKPIYSNRAAGRLIAVGTDFSKIKKIDLNVYGLFSAQDNFVTEESITVSPSINSTSFIERDSVQKETNNTLGLMRADFNFKISDKEIISIDSYVKIFSSSSDNERVYEFNNLYRLFFGNDLSSMTYRPSISLEYIKRSLNGHTHNTIMTFENDAGFQNLSLTSRDTAILQSLINWPPLTPQNIYEVKQSLTFDRNRLAFKESYDYRVNSKLYFTAVGSFNRYSLKSVIDLENTLEGSSNSVIGTDWKARLSSTFLLNTTTIKSSLSIYENRWSLIDEKGKISAFLPSINLKTAIPNIGIAEVSFKRDVLPINEQWYYRSALVKSATTYQLGSNSVRPYTQYNYSIILSSNNPLKFNSWNIYLSNKFSDNGQVIQSILLNGNERIQSYEFVSKRFRSSSISFNYSYDFPNSQLRVRALASTSSGFTRLVQGLVPIKNSLSTLNSSYKFFLGKKWDISTSCSMTRQVFKQSASSNELYNLDYRFKVNFKAKGISTSISTYGEIFQVFSNSLNNTRLELNIFYRKPNSPWGIEVKGYLPVGGESQLSVNQDLVFYQERLLSIFPKYIITSAVYHF